MRKYNKLKYRYYVSYSYKDGAIFGTGFCDINTRREIKTIKRIAEIKEFIEKKHDLKNVVILNYKLLRERV